MKPLRIDRQRNTARRKPRKVARNWQCQKHAIFGCGRADIAQIGAILLIGEGHFSATLAFYATLAANHATEHLAHAWRIQYRSRPGRTRNRTVTSRQSGTRGLHAGI